MIWDAAKTTKTNRKKLIGAYSDKSPICGIKLLENDEDIVFRSDNNKILCVNTEKIPLKSTKNTQGVQVMTLRKKGSKLTGITMAALCGIEDLKHYTAKNIPAAGSFLRKEDSQLSFE